MIEQLQSTHTHTQCKQHVEEACRVPTWVNNSHLWNPSLAASKGFQHWHLFYNPQHPMYLGLHLHICIMRKLPCLITSSEICVIVCFKGDSEQQNKFNKSRFLLIQKDRLHPVQLGHSRTREGNYNHTPHPAAPNYQNLSHINHCDFRVLL